MRLDGCVTVEAADEAIVLRCLRVVVVLLLVRGCRFEVWRAREQLYRRKKEGRYRSVLNDREIEERGAKRERVSNHRLCDI